jgi:hypothetical protein
MYQSQDVGEKDAERIFEFKVKGKGRLNNLLNEGVFKF